MIVLTLAILLDMILGDPINRYHPTAWIGNVIAYLKPKLKSEEREKEVIKGTIVALVIIFIVTASSYIIIFISSFFGYIILTIVSAVALKMTIAIKSMEEHAKKVIEALIDDNLLEARKRVSMIVGRDTSALDREHILSAVIESISESITDGITGALFYYSLMDIPGAFGYRAINTLDSMLAYKDEYHKNIGLFSAKLDTIANYIPARITGLLIILSAMILGLDWRRALKIMMRDKSNTPSLNGGWTISSMAGVLGLRLEKMGYYKIGDAYEEIEIRHCYMAIKIMKVTVLLFILLISFPLILLRMNLGWYT